MSKFTDEWYLPADLQTLERLVAEASPGRALELGTHEGRSALTILKRLYGHDLHMVDRWENDDVLVRFVDNVLQAYPFQTRMFVMDDIEFVVRARWRYTFVHIDSDHSYDHVKKLLSVISGVVWPGVGAIVCGHDFENSPDVQRAVKEVYPAVRHAGEVWWTKHN